MSTTLVDAHPYSSQSNGAAERAIQTARRQANTLMEELRHHTKLALPHEHPVFAWSFRHAAWLLNRYHKSSVTGRTAWELISGYPFKGELVPFGAMVMAKRLKPQREGDKIWNAGIFVGKTDGDLWLIYQEDGLHACRSVRPIGDTYNPEKLNNVRVYPWQVKHSLLGARVFPQKNQEKAEAVVPLALAPGESPEAVEDG